MNHNIGYFEALWAVLWGYIRQSGTYRLLRRIYDGISSSWRRSRITGWFRRENFSEDFLSASLAGRILRLPFTFLEWLRRRCGKTLTEKIKHSVFLGICDTYLNNFLALNLRFLGITLFFAGGGLILGGVPLGYLPALPLVLGILLFALDINLTDWLKHSRLVSFVCACFGIEADFNWYQNEKVQGKPRLLIGAAAGLLCGIAGGLGSPLIGLALLPGLAVLFLILKKPEAGMLFLVFLAPLAPTMAMAGLSILCLFSLIIKSLTDADFAWKFDSMGFLILSFILIYLFAGITSFAMMKSLSIWAIYLVFMAAYFLIIHLVKNRKQLDRVLTVFVLSGLCVCLYGIAQYVFGWDTAQAWMDEEMFSDIKMRIYSTLDNPNVLGEYILLVLPAAIGLMWTRKGALQKIVYAGISAVMFLALLLTSSRGCWLGFMASAAVFVTFVAGKLWGLVLIIVPLLPAVLPESIINRFTSIGDLKDSSTSYRVYIWMGTLAMIQDFWISGIGMGSEAFTEIYPFYAYNGIVAPHSHNLFLQILVESGIGGILVFLLILLFFLKKMMTGYQAGGGKGAPLSTLICALSAGVCGFLLQGMFDNCFYNYRVLLIFWYVIGIAMACTYIAKSLSKEDMA
ncbi:O-antigen ligase family protein [Ructibacterium gallinarum]|uniref:O-antigen ligase family protein n=1 Tax=Ructibacterium gallinarum TaxID=2779355 RepID=A0A9D5LWT2_9FIRM|nr:O-antigen ligase family protein [Ructibacterium gallinarum]MBE5039196.1 O-antigen ligase family protein [Ructibacterium gallinarum]